MRRHRLKLAIALVVLAVLGALCWGPVQQVRSIIALESVLQREGIVSIAPSGYMPALDKAFDTVAKALPGFAGKVVTRARQALSRTHWDRLVAADVDQMVLHVRVIPQGLSEALHRFPRLRVLIIQERPSATPSTSQEDWKELCRAVSAIPRLEHLTLEGNNIADEALTPLAGHPSLRSLALSVRHLTPQCASTLGKLPALKRFELKPDYLGGTQTYPLRNALHAALPSIELD